MWTELLGAVVARIVCRAYVQKERPRSAVKPLQNILQNSERFHLLLGAFIEGVPIRLETREGQNELEMLVVREHNHPVCFHRVWRAT